MLLHRLLEDISDLLQKLKNIILIISCLKKIYKK